MRKLVLAAAMVVAALLSGCNGSPEPITNAPPPAVRAQAAQALGGTLAVRSDGAYALASDPDVDRLWIADLRNHTISGEVRFDQLDDPGRPVFGTNGRGHVILRGSGEVATFNVADPQRVHRLGVCAEPRGLAFDNLRNELLVACAGGELVFVSEDGERFLRMTKVAPDLRDVFVREGDIYVSRLRSGELVHLSTSATTPREVQRLGEKVQFKLDDGRVRHYEPSVLWRVKPLRDGSIAFLQQRSSPDPVTISQTPTDIPDPEELAQSTSSCTAYGGCASGGPARRALDECETISQSVFMVQRPDGTLTERRVRGAAPVDFAVDETSGVAWVVKGDGSSADIIHLSAMLPTGKATSCATSGVRVTGQQPPVAVALLPDGQPLFQSKVSLYTLHGVSISLPAVPRPDTSGRDLFVQPAEGSGLACASCHPDGLDDGRVWNFDSIGPRRTPPLVGGLVDTAPFHWDGDMKDFDHLMLEVFVGRMGARPSLLKRAPQMLAWLDSLPGPRHTDAELDDAARRGEALFHDATVGCASCHSGSRFTNNATMDVGTGGKFQVPRLVGLAGRAPYMHDGCAQTLEQRFDPACGGANHGNVSGLSPEQLHDLVEYLKTL
ncbi:MAG: c-type cytochrome [Myxococcaceae bacterium]|nr:c-type cytochrome [Myxococcaceae bacterium]